LYDWLWGQENVTDDGWYYYLPGTVVIVGWKTIEVDRDTYLRCIFG
jgi:hypothetical protein